MAIGVVEGLTPWLCWNAVNWMKRRERACHVEVAHMLRTTAVAEAIPGIDGVRPNRADVNVLVVVVVRWMGEVRGGCGIEALERLSRSTCRCGRRTCSHFGFAPPAPFP